LDGIEPRGGCRGEMEHEARMFADPFPDLRMLVGRIVIDDDMDHRLFRHLGIDDIEEADELLMAMTLHALADDLALKAIARREQGGVVVSLILVGHGARAAPSSSAAPAGCGPAPEFGSSHRPTAQRRGQAD